MAFRDIIGHARVVSLLSRAVARGRVPPTLLLAGPEGVGKRRMALALARAVNCLEPVTGKVVTSPTGTTALIEHDACGECASCRRIARGTHPEIIRLTPGDMGSIKIEAVRDVIDRAQYRPFEGRRRVVVIEHADALTDDAQSALLKILEEPPPGSVFLLITSAPDALLPTVRSRCPRLRFGRLSASEVALVLTRDHGYDEEEARAVAAIADGSVGHALEAQASDLTDARATAHRWLNQSARGQDLAGRVQMAQSFFDKKREPAAERARLAVCLRALSSLLRDLGILSSRADAGMLANGDLHSALEGLTSAYDSARTMRAFAAVDEALVALDRNASPKVVADWVVLRL